jgi:hypothetical protein
MRFELEELKKSLGKVRESESKLYNELREYKITKYESIENKRNESEVKIK